MNYISNFTNARLGCKRCAGKGCDRVGKIILKVKYLNKFGRFCDRCANDLIIGDLAVKVGDKNA